MHCYDPRESALTSFLNAKELENQLNLLCCAEWGWGRVEHIQTRVLKCHPGKRCTFGIAVKTDRGSHELIGKVFAQERPDVCEHMAEIYQAGFGCDSKFAIPKPLTYLTALHLLFEEQASGTPVRKILLTAGLSEQKKAAIRCALWLAKFHTSAPRIGPITNMEKIMLSESRSLAGKLARLGDPFAEKSRQLLAELGERASELGIVPFCVTHGSYTYRHVLLEGDRTVVVDWDGCQVSDPARNVATFIAAAKWMALKFPGSIRTFDLASDAFLQAYIGERGQDILQRLPFHLGAAYLRHAAYCTAHQFDRWEEKAMLMLEEGLSVPVVKKLVPVTALSDKSLLSARR